MKREEINQTRETVYVVTGATGFIGNNIVRVLLRQGKRVRCFVRSEQKARELFGEDTPECTVGSVTDPAAFEAALLGDFDFVVIHAAGVVSIGKKLRAEMTAINVGGTRNVVDVCVRRRVKKFVFVSSVHAIDEPQKGQPVVETEDFDLRRIKGDYAKTKSESTAYVFDAAKHRGLDAVIVHPSGVIGPNDFGSTYLTQLILDYSKNRIPAGVVGGYNFVDVRDVAEGVAAAAEKGRTGACYLLTGNYVSVERILGLLHEFLGKRRIKLILPMWTAKFALPFLTCYSKLTGCEPLYNRYSLYTLSSNSDFRNDRARDELGFDPRPIEDSVRDSIAFLRETRRI